MAAAVDSAILRSEKSLCEPVGGNIASGFLNDVHYLDTQARQLIVQMVCRRRSRTTRWRLYAMGQLVCSGFVLQVELYT